MNGIINYYNKYDEDGRITSSKARKVEFLLTTNTLDRYIKENDNILEVGAGTGVYSFYYADKGHKVTATDLVPSNVEMIKEKLLALDNKEIQLSAEVVNATDLSRYEDESFHIVTCLGPLYHIVDVEDRNKCIEEALRVLKKGGILALAYINKHYVVHSVMLSNNEYLNKGFVDKILNTGTIKEGEKECFWTDAFFTTPTEMEELIKRFDIETLDHVGTDGMTPFVRKNVDEMNNEEYEAWIHYQLKSCRDREILGMSNHGLIVVKKK